MNIRGEASIPFLLWFNIKTAALVYGTIQALTGQRAGFGECVAKGLSKTFPVVGVAVVVTTAMFAGMLMFIVPGLIATVLLWVAIPAAVVEKAGVGGSLRRSLALTKGHRFAIFIIVAAIWTMSIAAMVVFPAISGLSEAGGSEPSPLHLLYLLFSEFCIVLAAVASAVGYQDLRRLKEDISVGQIAAVFD